MLALDPKTCKLLWDQEVGETAAMRQMTGAPLAVHGKIIQGVSGCLGHDYPGGCFIVALDAATGEELWRFYSIARPDQPGGDSWNGAPLNQRFGVSVWTAGSYDPDLNLVYFGTGQTYTISTLLKPNARKGQSKDALYSDSTLALNPDTGKLVWYYQHFPGDVWDLDWAFEQTLIKLEDPTGPLKAVVTSGKLGIIDALDAKTGRYLWSRDMGVQNLVIAIDPRTGHKTYDPRLIPDRGEPKLVCPSSLGGRDWAATAYDPQSGVMYLPMSESCMDISFNETNWGDMLIAARVPPKNDGKFGRIVAINLRNRQIVWTNRRRAPQSSAVLATAGGLIFEGGRDRWFRALDSGTGRTLWQTRLEDTPNSFPISFAVGATQYVAVVSGGGTPLDLQFRKFTPEIRSSIGSKTLLVFSLMEHGKVGTIAHTPRNGSAL